MADNENDTQAPTEKSDKSGKELRKLLEDALGELKAIKTENADLKSHQRSATLAELLKSNQAKAGAEKLYPRDAEVTEEAVKAWVEENAAFVRDEGSSTSKPNASEETVTNARRLAALADGAGSSSAGDLSDFITRIDQAKTKEDLDAIYAELGVKHVMS